MNDTFYIIFTTNFCLRSQKVDLDFSHWVWRFFVGRNKIIVCKFLPQNWCEFFTSHRISRSKPETQCLICNVRDGGGRLSEYDRILINISWNCSFFIRILSYRESVGAVPSRWLVLLISFICFHRWLCIWRYWLAGYFLPHAVCSHQNGVT